MEQIKKNSAAKYILILILAVTSFFHLLWLDRMPPGMSHDEVIYSLSAKTFQMRGVDISGTHLPLGLFRTETEGNISMLPLVFLAPFYSFLDLSQATARIPYVFFIYLSGAAVFLIAKNLFKNENIALIALLLFLSAPWSFFLARFTAEPSVALVFYLWGIASFFYLRKRKLIITFLIFSLAFFSYHGGKVLFLPLIILCIIYFSIQKRLSRREGLNFLIAAFLVFSAFTVISFSIPGGIAGERKNEIFFLNSEFLASSVDKKREITLETKFTPILVNKATIAVETFFQKYITSFSPTVLFLEGDTRLAYAFLYHGLLHKFDALFIVFGGVALFIKRRKEALFLFGLILISPLPSALNAVMDSYINRSMLLILPLILLSAYGVHSAFLYLTKKTSRLFSFITLFAVISFSTINFLFFYFFQYPVSSSDSFVLGEKLAAEFIRRSNNNNRSVIAVKNEVGNLYLETIFFSQKNTYYTSLIENPNFFDENVYRLENTEFRGDCPENYDINTVYVLEEVKQCKPPFENKTYIKSPQDAGIIYTIYNSDLCSGYSLSPWLRYRYLADYAVNKMDNRTFCERWISV